uniref:LRAT domain-containing protein n=1 Tax=Panagrolaimus sp. JU765 TaxID=591449 RepID=A0AC34PZB2_9BILA
MDLVLPQDKVPEYFRERVKNILDRQKMGDVILKTWGKTNFGQHFVFVVSKVLWYAVRLIVDEEYWYYPVVYYQNLENKDICEKKEFLTFEGVENYIEKTLENIKNDYFGKKMRFRVRKVPKWFWSDPDKFLKKGAQLQRYLSLGAKLVKIGSHEGVYLGNGKVAHVSAEDHIKLKRKNTARPRIDTLVKFLGDPRTELRIVDHVFRQRDPKDIVEFAELYVNSYKNNSMSLCRNGNARIYNLISNNCQHFANYCVTGRESMTELRNMFQEIENMAIMTVFFIKQLKVDKHGNPVRSMINWLPASDKKR